MGGILNLIESVSEGFPSYSLDVVCGFLLFIFVNIKVENSKKWMFNVRHAGDHLYGKWLFTW